MTADSLDTRLEALVNRDQAQVCDPFPLFDDLRRESPVHFSEAAGAWVLTRHTDCLSVLHDPITWSVNSYTGPQGMGGPMGERIMEIAADPETAHLMAALTQFAAGSPMLASVDPPLHSEHRKLVNPAFKPGRVRSLEPLMSEVTDRLLAGMRRGVEIDYVEAFAVPLPMAIIAQPLGVPDEDFGRFKTWSDNLVMPVGNHDPSRAQVESYLRSQAEYAEFFMAKIAERRAAPHDDLISEIATATIDGQPLADGECLSIVGQVLSAGNETTTKLLTDIVWRLAADTTLQDSVRTDPTQVPALVEEALRLAAPVAGLFRQATVDTEVGGRAIAAGEHVLVMYSAACRDPDRFEAPTQVILDRGQVSNHLAFGHGQHYCLGANLARAEARIATDRLLDQTTSIQLGPSNDFRFEDSYLLRGLRELRIVLR